MRFLIVGAAVAPSSLLGGANEPSGRAVSMHTGLLRQVRWGARGVTAAALISKTTGSCDREENKRWTEMKHDFNLCRNINERVRLLVGAQMAVVAAA